jgi:hypothetical protein
MLSTRTSTKAPTLGLEDYDDVDLIRAIEGSFAVRFGEKTMGWITVGDIYDALLATMTTNGEAGLCPTSMAFYRLRAALVVREGTSERLRPTTDLSQVTQQPPTRFVTKLCRGLRLAPPLKFMSWRGVSGMCLTLIGSPTLFLFLHDHSLWPLLLLAPVGIAITSTDPGVCRSTTIGELARRVAARNFDRFASMGADTRPLAVWRALRDLIADQTYSDAEQITLDTRLIA